VGISIEGRESHPSLYYLYLTYGDAKLGPVRVQFRRALALRSEIRRVGWFD